MKRILTILAGLLLAYPLLGKDYDREVLSVTSGTNASAAVSASTANVRGVIEEIYIDLTTATTGTVSVVLDPELSTMANITLYSGSAITNDKVLKPTFVTHDSAGATNADWDRAPIVCVGDKITLTASAFNATNKNIKAVIKYSK